MLFLILCMYLIEEYIYPEFSKNWQSTTPGMLFAFLFFGVQFEIYTSLRNEYQKLRIENLLKL
jgi:amino acid permease